MKKTLLGIILFFCIFIGINEQIYAHSVDDNQIYKTKEFTYGITEDGYVAIVEYNGKDEKVNIPSEYKGYEVVIIEDECFKDNTKIKEVHLPNTIQSIGIGAFYGCTNLKKINIPNSVTDIGGAAFQDCDNLKKIEMDEDFDDYELHCTPYYKNKRLLENLTALSIVLLVIATVITILALLNKKANKELNSDSKYIGVFTIPYAIISLLIVASFAVGTDEFFYIIMLISGVIILITMVINIVKYKAIGIFITIIRAITGIVLGLLLIATIASGVGIILLGIWLFKNIRDGDGTALNDLLEYDRKMYNRDDICVDINDERVYLMPDNNNIKGNYYINTKTGERYVKEGEKVRSLSDINSVYQTYD